MRHLKTHKAEGLKTLRQHMVQSNPPRGGTSLAWARVKQVKAASSNQDHQQQIDTMQALVLGDAVLHNITQAPNQSQLL